MKKRKLIIVGAGGFAREVRWLAADITAAGPEGYEFVGYVASTTSEHDSTAEIVGDFTWLGEHPDDFECLAMGIGSAATRLEVANELESRFGPEYWPALIHPTAQLDRGSAHIGHGVMLCANVVGTVNLILEPFAMVNLSCTIGHEAKIGRACTLNPTVNISGGVTIGDGTLVGTGAQILQYLTIGSGTIVGAGALVTKSVGDNKIAVGMPARAR